MTKNYTYIYTVEPAKLICCIDQNVSWHGQTRSNGIPFVGLCSTGNHPETWNKAYRLVNFTEFSFLTGVTMNDILRG